MDSSRRDFIRATLGGFSVAALAQQAMAQQPGQGVPTRRLGRTNVQVSILCLGGAHIGYAGRENEKEAIRIMHAAIDQGINFFDNAWMYNDGYSEELMGKALGEGKRQKVFLMTKNSGRDYDFSKRCLEDSLRQLKTDYIDLWQFHEINYDNDPEWVFERGGHRAALEAQKDGKVRFIGFTGHKHPEIHLKMLDMGYAWASSQMPINVMDHFYRSFQNRVVPVCLKEDVGVIGMKSLGGGRKVGRIPSSTKITAEQCVRFGLSLPIASLCRGYETMEELEQDLKIARNFRPMDEQEKQQLLALARPEAGDGRHERFKSTQAFDARIYREMHGLGDTGR